MPANEPTNSQHTQKMRMHEAKLQTLDREINKGMKFSRGAFKDSEQDWEGVPAIFAKEHPNMDAWDKDQAAELKRINGRIVGMTGWSYVPDTGSPRLMGSFGSNDAEVDDLADSGKLTLSTGFRALPADGGGMSKVMPHHLLLFEEDENNRPVDQGAMVLNKESNEDEPNFYECHGCACGTNHIHGDNTLDTNIDRQNEVHNNMTDETANLEKLQTATEKIGDITSKLNVTNKEKATVEASLVETQGMLEIANKEKDTLTATIADKDAAIEVANNELTDVKAKLEEFKNKEAEALVAKRDGQWVEIKNSIQPGLTHKPEDEKALRTEWETDPASFSVKLLTISNKMPDRGVDGSMYNKEDGGAPNTTGVFTPGQGFK